MGRSGFCARRARAARHPGYGRTGYCPRAPPAALRWADPVFARASAARRATSRLWANRVLPARAACRLEMGKNRFLRASQARAPRVIRLWANRVLPARAACRLEMGRSVFARARARATSRLWANRVLPARAACRLEMGRSGFCARRARATRHPGYGRTGYCPRAPPAALRWADPVFARAAARRATSRLWANRVLPARAACRLEMGRSGFCARRARGHIPVMGEPGIARARRLPP